MLLTIDIGNTTVSIGVLKGQRVMQIYSVEPGMSQAQFYAELKTSLSRIKRKFHNVKSAVIFSVAPKVLNEVKRAVASQLKIQSKIIGKNLKVPLKNN